MLALCGVGVLIVGFALRLNPLVVVMAAALTAGLAAGLSPITIIAAFGKAFGDARYITVVYMVLPVIGLLERYGLQSRARALINRMRGASAGRILLAYLFFRQITAALGLTSVAGPAQTVRPLIVPMALSAAQVDEEGQQRDQIAAMAAATDNVGLLFGEDIFIAIGSILLMKGVLQNYNIVLEPLQLSVWAIPTACAALVIHGIRLWLLDLRLRRAAK